MEYKIGKKYKFKLIFLNINLNVIKVEINK